MDFDDWVIEAAHKAAGAVNRAMTKYRDGLVTDEDDLTGVLVGCLDTELQDRIGGLTWKTSILRHRRGIASEETKIGADMIFHVRFRSQNRNYSKGVLIQSKRCDRFDSLSASAHAQLVAQCQKMGEFSAASFVFDYTRSGVRCGSASRIGGSKNRQLYSECNWTAYRFFHELFSCAVGDTRITSARALELPVPFVVLMSAEGEEPPLY